MCLGKKYCFGVREVQQRFDSDLFLKGQLCHSLFLLKASIPYVAWSRFMLGLGESKTNKILWGPQGAYNSILVPKYPFSHFEVEEEILKLLNIFVS